MAIEPQFHARSEWVEFGESARLIGTTDSGPLIVKSCPTYSTDATDARAPTRDDSGRSTACAVDRTSAETARHRGWRIPFFDAAQLPMSPAPTSQTSDCEPGDLLRELEQRQDEVLKQLDDLDDQLREVLRGLGATMDDEVDVEIA